MTRLVLPCIWLHLQDLRSSVGLLFPPAPVSKHRKHMHAALLQGGLRPHAFCLPILKREEHRAAVLAAATSGSPKFFLGTDSAPHPKGAKVIFSRNSSPVSNARSLSLCRFHVPASFEVSRSTTGPLSGRSVDGALIAAYY